MLTEKHLAILGKLREDARMSLARIGRETGLATSTVFDYYKRLRQEAIVRHVALPDFKRLGLALHKQFLVRSGDRKKALAWLKRHPTVNNLYRVDSHDAFFDAHFADANGYETFVEEVRRALRPKELKAFDVLEELKHEAFVPGA